jgi:hypothetical protein
MTVRLFSLRGVPDDEAEEVRTLLSDNDIDFYETSPGNWGISTPGIWLRDEKQLHQARALIQRYQEERADEQRKIYEQLKQEGKQRTFLRVFIEDPLKVIAYIAIAGLILYFSTKPFLNLGK